MFRPSSPHRVHAVHDLGSDLPPGQMHKRKEGPGGVWSGPSGSGSDGTSDRDRPCPAASRSGAGRLESAATQATCIPSLPQRDNQPDRQQRVPPAQREEVILRTHPIPPLRTSANTPQQDSSANVAGLPARTGRPAQMIRRRRSQRGPVHPVFPLGGTAEAHPHHEHRRGPPGLRSRAAA